MRNKYKTYLAVLFLALAVYSTYTLYTCFSWYSVSLGGVSFLCVLGLWVEQKKGKTDWKKEIAYARNEGIDLPENKSIEPIALLEEWRKKYSQLSHKITSLKNQELGEVSFLSDSNDLASNALVDFFEEQQKARKQEKDRTWAASGLAQLGDILRQKENLEHYFYDITRFLSKYIGASQAYIYIAEEDAHEGMVLELKACFAYDRKKFHENTRIHLGEGLMGQCMYEKEEIILTNVPQDYLHITSGLGEANPASIGLFPLIFNENLVGGIEFARFEAFQPFEIEFLKECCAIIAAEISTLKTIAKTQLLLEESQKLTQALKTKDNEMKSYLRGIDNTIASVSFDLEGWYLSANDMFLNVLGYAEDELTNTKLAQLMPDAQSANLMWENLLAGKFFSGEFKMKAKDGKEMWLMGTFNPIQTSDDSISKITMLAQFTTQEKEKLIDLQVIALALKSTLPVVELNEKLDCKLMNEMALSMFGFSRIEVKNKRMENLIDVTHSYFIEQFNEHIFNHLLEKEILSYDLPFILKNQEMVWYHCNFVLARNLEGKVKRIFLIMVNEISIHNILGHAQYSTGYFR